MDAVVTNNVGERVIDISLKRHRAGVRVMVKITPEVEAFFQRWGGGVVETATHGRLWNQLGTERLTFWSLNTDFLGGHDEPNYSLYHTGSGLRLDSGLVNLSFIRLCGAMDGKQFLCDAVMSRSEMEKIAAQLRKASEHFYTEYIQKVHLNIFVGVRDVLRGEL